METDASDYVIAGVLSQYNNHPDGKCLLHPVAFYSRRMTPAECNYKIHDKELLAIIVAFEEWRRYLISTPDPIRVITDHKNLEYFTTTKALNRRQARWSEKLAEYNFQISYRPGTQGGKPDALTRRSGDLPKEGDKRLLDMQKAILKPENFKLLTVSPRQHLPEILSVSTMNLESEIEDAQKVDTLCNSIRKALLDNSTRHADVPLAECSIDDNIIKIFGLILVPDNPGLQKKIIDLCHAHPALGHPGRAKTFEIVTRSYWWPKVRKTIARYVNNCDTCARCKPARHAPYGQLKTLEVPQRRWKDISIDFVTGLPTSKECTAILVVVDRLSKMVHFIATTETLTAGGLAALFRDHIWRLHGIPSSITSDRGSLFTSEFWKHLSQLLETKRNLSTAFRPQTDGQTERTNANMEQYLRMYCNYQQDNWVELLSMAEFAMNNTKSATTGMTPFFANYGFHPDYTVQKVRPSPPPDSPEVVQYVDRLQNLDDYLHAEITWMQDAQAEAANQRLLPAPVYHVGDEVWLHRRFIRTTRPSSKLDYKKLGRFKILEKVSSHAYKLDLPPSMKVHPVFHVSLLEPAFSDPLSGQKNPPPQPIIVDGEEEWLVEKIVSYRIRHGKLQYLVKWTGYNELTWEPADSFTNTNFIEQFHLDHPEAPAP